MNAAWPSEMRPAYPVRRFSPTAPGTAIAARLAQVRYCAGTSTGSATSTTTHTTTARRAIGSLYSAMSPR